MTSAGNKQDWQVGDIKILHHPDPKVLKKAIKIQEEAKQERINEVNKKD